MKDVIVYSSNTCPYCTLAKQYLEEKGVAFVEKNVQTDKDARAELMAMGHMGVPVLVIDGEQIVGFDKDRLETILDKRS
jgi:glutaredoxin-like YruB-family protein